MLENIINHIGLWGITGIAFGYLVGSIPFGLVLCRIAGLGDIRNIGSGNIGATNVLRTGRKDLALATFLLDSFKGGIITFLLSVLVGKQAMYGAAFGAILGHCYPVWLNFKGGKGGATALGVSVALSPSLCLLCFITWILTLLGFRISSLATLTAIITAPFWAYILGQQGLMFLSALLGVIVLIRHHENMRRLIKGEESKVALFKKASK